MSAADIRGRRALITGASSGIGTELARELAARGAHTILVARRRQRLDELAAELRERHGVEVDVIAMDLGTADAPAALERAVADAGREVDILVNNAGFGIHGPFLDIPWERERAMLQLDVVTLVELTKRFARPMVARGRGWILQVASIGAFQPSPSYATYSAAKSFVLSFGEAIAQELRGTGVSCTVLSPGVTASEFLEVAGNPLSWYQRAMMMPADRVARVGVRAMLRGRSSLVSGLLNSLIAWSMRFVPRRLMPVAAGLATRLGSAR